MDMFADETSDDGKHTENSQVMLATSAQFMPMFGVALRYGRNWDATEENARLPVVTIDTDLARKLFGTENAVGRSVKLKKTLFRVIGVFEPFAPQPRFYGLNVSAFSSDGNENLYVPYLAALDAGLTPFDSDSCDAPAAGSKEAVSFTDPVHCSALGLWVQLDTPQQVADYREYLTHYAEQQKALAGFGKKPQAQLISVAEWLKLQDVVPQSVRLNVWLAASFLLLCMFNVAGLLAARFLHRSAEIGIRRALGAPRFSVFMQHVLEASAVCLVGGVLALPLTLLGLWILRHQGNEFSGLARLDTPMFDALFVLALLVGALVGVLPAWRASAVEPGLQIKSD
jgi:putative ABC transport system permease protein